MSLKSFLLEGKNSRTKEAILNFLLFSDLKLAAAERGYDLSIFVPDIDQHGYDVILDDSDRLKKLQIKTVLKTANTSSWYIHKTMLRPDIYSCEKLGFESSPSGAGYSGGVILLEIDAKKVPLSVAYYYTDIFIITALRDRIIDRIPRRTGTSVMDNFYKAIRNGISHEKIRVAKSMFIKARFPSHLLALMGLHSKESSSWIYNLLLISQSELRATKTEDKLPAPVDKLRNSVALELVKLASDIKAVKY